MGMLPVLEYAQIPVMIEVKKEVGEEKASAAARALIGCLIYSFPNLVVNFLFQGRDTEDDTILENQYIYFKLVYSFVHIFLTLMIAISCGAFSFMKR